MRKYPKTPAKIQFTKEGLETLQKEHDELVSQRADAVHELRTASAMGDRSENAAYKVARQKLSALDRRIRQTAHLLRYGVVVEREFTGRVDIGCTVTVHDGKQERTYVIVGGYESDVSQGKLSCFSPIGKALMDKKKDDSVQIQVPVGLLTLKVLDVSA